MIRILLSIALIGAAIGAATVGILGFQGSQMRKPPFELFPDMDRQAKLRPQEPNHFFANGVSSQLPLAGTVARSEPIHTVSGDVYAFEDSPVNTGRATGTTNFVETNPLPVNAALLAHGRERFDIYCAPCHGRRADGGTDQCDGEKNTDHSWSSTISMFAPPSCARNSLVPFTQKFSSFAPTTMINLSRDAPSKRFLNSSG